MSGWVLTFFFIGLLAAVTGFGGMATAAVTGIARLVFFTAVVVLVGLVLGHLRERG